MNDDWGDSPEKIKKKDQPFKSALMASDEWGEMKTTNTAQVEELKVPEISNGMPFVTPHQKNTNNRKESQFDNAFNIPKDRRRESDEWGETDMRKPSFDC